MADAEISVVMPAFSAESVIADAAGSLVRQTFPFWRLIIVADDGVDYGEVLAGAGIEDSRIEVIASARRHSGASAARNAGLDAVRTRYVAVLDADDLFAPQKLERSMAALGEHAIVSTALSVVGADLKALRTVAAGPDRALDAGRHKWVNLSMDSMIAWDSARVEARYDGDLPNMNDLDFLLRLFRTGATSFHIGAPLHLYRKMPSSLSNGAGVTARMVAAKRLIRDRLGAGYYGLASEQAEGVIAFLDVSLQAELSYGSMLADNPALLFEDHLEPLLRVASTSAS